MKKPGKRVLVMGMGNDIQQDVGIPVHLVDDLSGSFGQSPVDFEHTFVGGLELLEFIHGYEGVVFIDTLKTKDRQPGRIHLFSPEHFRETLHLSCRHDVSFLTSLEMGRKLGFRIPENILIIGVEILEDLEFGAGLSHDLSDRYPGILEEIKDTVRKFNRYLAIRPADEKQ